MRRRGGVGGVGAGSVVGISLLVVLLCDGVGAWHASFGQASAPTESTTSGAVPFDIPRPRVDGEHGDLAISRCEVAEASVRKALAVCDPGMSCDTTQRCDRNCLQSWQSALRDSRILLARTSFTYNRFAPPFPFFSNVQCVRETQILVAHVLLQRSKHVVLLAL